MSEPEYTSAGKIIDSEKHLIWGFYERHMGRGPIIGNRYADEVLADVESDIKHYEGVLRALKERREQLRRSIEEHNKRGF